MTFTFPVVLDPVHCPLLLTLWGHLGITWQRGFTVKPLRSVPTHGKAQSTVQLVALETLNDTHPAYKTKFMNQPASLKMAISTKEQMCYFTWYLRIPVLVGGLAPYILKSRSGCSAEPRSSPHPNTNPLANKNNPWEGQKEGEREGNIELAIV